MNRTHIRNFGSTNSAKSTLYSSDKNFENFGNPATIKEGSSESVNEDIGEVNCFTTWKIRTFRNKIFYRLIPVLNWLPEYSPREKLLADFIAGVTIALTLLPQGLAYASVAGVPPQYGLYSSFVGCFVYILLGGTKVVTIGPTAIMSIVAFEYGHVYPPEYYVMLCFFTGIITFAMGVFQLGFIVNFISTPVLSAFTTASAITIVSTQIKALFGLSFPSEGFISDIEGTFSRTDEFKLNDSILSLISIAILLFLQSLSIIRDKIPEEYVITNKILWFLSTSRSAILIVLATTVFTIIGDKDYVAIVGHVEKGLPTISPPKFKFSGNNSDGEFVESGIKDLFNKDFSALIVIPLLALIEHVTIAKACACGVERVDPSQELLTIGVSNIIGSFFGSIPITGSFSRTLVNHSSGAQSPLGGLFTGILVILSLLFLTPLFEYIPKASLAAVIVCAVIFSVDIKILFTMWKSKRMDILPWIATLATSLLLGLQFGILTGFGISLVFLLYYSARPGIRVERAQTTRRVEFILVELDRSLVFPSVEFIRYVINKTGTVWGQNNLPVVIDFQHIQFADFTAAKGIWEMFLIFNDRGQELILLHIKNSILRILSGVRETSGPEFKHVSSERQLEDLLHKLRRLESTDDHKMRAKRKRSRVSVVMES